MSCLNIEEVIVIVVPKSKYVVNGTSPLNFKLSSTFQVIDLFFLAKKMQTGTTFVGICMSNDLFIFSIGNGRSAGQM